MMKRKPTLAAVIVAGGLVASSLIVADGLARPSEGDVPAEVRSVATESPTERNPATGIAAALNETFVSLAERVKPGVVRIEVRAEGRAGPSSSPQFELPEPFRRFFDIPDLEQMPRDPMPRIGGGTGFLVSDDGYIVTNHHVVADADEITVWLENRYSYEAELVGSDPTTDVAVIRIDGEHLPALNWGSSDDLRVGQWVIAIGNPGLGGNRPLEYTVTSGIVSAKERPLQLIGRSLQEDTEFGPDLANYAIENFIQTDAVINPGNSGGPLVNLYGEVVGINTAIASTSGYYQGYGFAVPGDLARRVVEDLIEDGTVERAWLGVLVSGVTPEDAEYYGLSRVSGVLVQDVTERSPADRAGLLREDVIIGVDGEQVDRGGGLQQLVAEHRPGDEVSLQIVRDGDERELVVELGEAPLREVTATRPSAGSPRTAALDRLGLQVEDLTDRRARELGYETASGVVVRDVEPAGPAARRGVVPGWRIVELNRQEIDSVEALEQRLARVGEGEIVRLLLETPAGERRVANIRAR